MFVLRPARERGAAQLGWLDTRYTFSFADYYDPAHVGFRALRVMNEDRVQPGAGFGMHGHRDMEIVTYILSGALAHRDSLGNGETLRAGELQHMTAGSGVRHSEMNPSADEPVHLYQIWLRPARPGLAPEYQQRRFDPADRRGRWQLVVSPDGREGSLPVHQDARLFLADLARGQSLEYALAPGRHAWLQVLRGAGELNGLAVSAGDGVAISDEPNLRLASDGSAEVMLFDLA